MLAIPSEPRSDTHLLIDALYFHAARQAHARALRASLGIERAAKRWKQLEEKEQRIRAKYEELRYDISDIHDHEDRIGDLNSDEYDELEPLYIQFEGAHYDIGKAYAPQLKEIGVVHILCAASLEAHINSVAEGTLKGKEREQFERLALEAKWLFLPKVLGCRGFLPGSQPFQGFSQLLIWRNRLVHYRGMKEEWVYGCVPAFLLKLGLAIEESEKSIISSGTMIRDFCQQRKTEAPYWLRDDLNEMNYFDLRIVYPDSPNAGE